MRFTQILGKQNMRWLFKKKWEVSRKRKILDTQIPERLKRKGIEIVDAVEYTRPKQTLEKYVIPEPWSDDNPYEKIEDHPDWHEKICLFFRNDTNLLEGEKHVQVLTKTLINYGLPKQLQDIYDNLDVSSLDEIAQNYIETSLVHDAYQIKLPKIIDKERLWYKFHRVYGIPLERKVFLLFNSLLRLGDLHARNSTIILNHDILSKAKVSVPLEKEGDFIQFRVEAPLCVASRKPLPQFANEREVMETLEKHLPDIYPIKSILDLKEENLYKTYNFFPIPQGQTQRFIHTLLLYNLFSSDDWSQSQLRARAIGMCYGFAVAQARHLFGSEVVTLPHPITVQCIQTDAQKFEFVTFQLNTLSVDGIDGIKNLTWIDDEHKLFDRCEKVEGKLCFENFNNDVIRRFLTFYYNGLM